MTEEISREPRTHPSEFQKAAKSYRIGWAYAELAFQYGIAIVICSLIGSWLDGKFNTGNILLIVGVLFGAVGGFIILLKSLKAMNNKKSVPEGKSLEK